MAFEVECPSELLVSSACATPFSISTSARRTAVTLIGSKVAFRTRTGACITEGRLAAEGAGGVGTGSCAIAPSPIAGRGRRPILCRFSIASSLRRSTKVLLIWMLLLPARFRPAPPDALAAATDPGTIDEARTSRTVNPNTAAAPASFRTRARIRRRPSPQYIIYQQNAEVVNLGTLPCRVGATWISNVRKEIARIRAGRPSKWRQEPRRSDRLCRQASTDHGVRAQVGWSADRAIRNQGWRCDLEQVSAALARG